MSYWVFFVFFYCIVSYELLDLLVMFLYSSYELLGLFDLLLYNVV